MDLKEFPNSLSSSEYLGFAEECKTEVQLKSKKSKKICDKYSLSMHENTKRSRNLSFNFHPCTQLGKSGGADVSNGRG